MADGRWRALRRSGADEGRDFLALAGLRSVPERVHLRLLDAQLRAALGGLGDVVARSTISPA